MNFNYRTIVSPKKKEKLHCTTEWHATQHYATEIEKFDYLLEIHCNRKGFSVRDLIEILRGTPKLGNINLLEIQYSDSISFTSTAIVLLQ